MKKEFTEFKEMREELENKYGDFVNARGEFNTRVELAVSEGVIKEELLQAYALEDAADYYEMAKSFYAENSSMKELADAIKMAHPRYGERRFRETLVTSIIENEGLDYEEVHDELYLKTMVHSFYDNNEFHLVNAKENAYVTLGQEAGEKLNAMVEQGVEKAREVGAKVLNVAADIVRPYGEVAKGQLETAGEKTKGLANKGIKQLIKLLEKADQNTKTGE